MVFVMLVFLGALQILYIYSCPKREGGHFYSNMYTLSQEDLVGLCKNEYLGEQRFYKTFIHSAMKRQWVITFQTDTYSSCTNSNCIYSHIPSGYINITHKLLQICSKWQRIWKKSSDIWAENVTVGKQCTVSCFLTRIGYSCFCAHVYLYRTYLWYYPSTVHTQSKKPIIVWNKSLFSRSL